MSSDVEHHFLEVLEFVAPGLDLSAHSSIAEGISRRMRGESNPRRWQSLYLLLQLDLGKPLNLYRCVSNELVGTATEQQILASAREYRANGVIKLHKRQYYVL
jgi:hypothetical protein